ncbi:MAG: hypothetical protein B6245_10510 [Desulfobacteraceae bacterium 4572_88]|nr:MAG: hypothetical protein B6245_10510 [Desulfobacteraceae bacterium 4572_88]
MTLKHRKVEYYNIVIQGHIAEGSKLLATIADAGVDFLLTKQLLLNKIVLSSLFFPKNPRPKGDFWGRAFDRPGILFFGKSLTPSACSLQK